MKRLLLVFIITVTSAGLAGAQEREFASKQITRTFSSTAEAGKWRLASLPFKEWIEAVTFPDWRLLYSSETNDFYFAMFRSDGHLIFWTGDRMGHSPRAACGVTAAGEAATVEPSKWAVLRFQLEGPRGGVKGQETATVFEIKDGLRGDLTVQWSMSSDKTHRTAFQQTIPWEQ